MSDKSSVFPAIIVVEDDLHIQIILRRVVSSVARGYELLAVSSGVAAMELISQRSVPLVFTDYNLPGMNGIQIGEAIHRESPSTVVVLVTAYATPELEKQARLAAINHFLAKPFRIEQVEKIIRTTLQ